LFFTGYAYFLDFIQNAKKALVISSDFPYNSRVVSAFETRSTRQFYLKTPETQVDGDSAESRGVATTSVSTSGRPF
jgi:hypothetical protein